MLKKNDPDGCKAAWTQLMNTTKATQKGVLAYNNIRSE